MMIVQRTNLTRPLPDRYFAWSPAELEDEAGRVLLLREGATDERDRMYWQHELTEIDRRLARVRMAGYRVRDRARTARLVTFARELKGAVDLPVFVRDRFPFTTLDRAGDRWTGHCPIPDHDDSSPSFVIYPDRGWYCHGCHRGGDIFTLVGLAFGLESFREQVHEVAGYVGQVAP